MAVAKRAPTLPWSLVDFREECIAGIDYRIARIPEEIYKARLLQYEIYLEAGFETRTDFSEVLNRDEFAKHADWVVAAEAEDQPTVVGTLALHYYDPVFGIETLNHFGVSRKWKKKVQTLLDEQHMNPDKPVIVEVARLAKSRKYNVGPGLYRQVYQRLSQLNAKAWFVNSDYRVYRALTERYRIPFHQIGRERQYKGSITVPAVLFLDELEDKIGAENPAFWRFLSADKPDESDIMTVLGV
jgi:hypothetical protein